MSTADTLHQLVHGYLRQDDSFATGSDLPALVDDGIVTLDQIEANLAFMSQSAAAPALAIYNFMMGTTPAWGGGEDFLTATFQLYTGQTGSIHEAAIELAANFYLATPMAGAIDAMSPEQFAAWLYPCVFGPTPPSVGALAWTVHDEQYYSQQWGGGDGTNVNLIGKLATIGGALDLNFEGLGFVDSPQFIQTATQFLGQDAHGAGQWGREMFDAVAHPVVAGPSQ